MLKKAKIVGLAALMATSLFAATAQAEPSANAQGYWDNDAMRNAKPIELQIDRTTGLGKLVTPTATPNASTGSDWPATAGGIPQTAVGKIFFTSGAFNYVCSGALITDASALDSEAIVLTAGHCVIDKGKFVTKFMFVPNYDSYVDANGNVSVPADAKWYASNLVVRTEFASAKQFNNTAIQHDWGFAVIPTGSFTKDRVKFTNEANAPDTNGNSFALSVGGFSEGNTSTAYGYPAAFPYSGKYLIYARGSIITDPATNTTWGMASTLTGGASGGPWLSTLAGDYLSGSVSSLNSYKYTNDTSKMYGPKFGPKTTATYSAALGAIGTSNIIVTN